MKLVEIGAELRLNWHFNVNKSTATSTFFSEGNYGKFS